MNLRAEGWTAFFYKRSKSVCDSWFVDIGFYIVREVKLAFSNYDWNNDGLLDITEFGSFENRVHPEDCALWDSVNALGMYIRVSLQYLSLTLYVGLHMHVCLCLFS